MAYFQKGYELNFLFMPENMGLGNARKAIHMVEISKIVHYFDRLRYIIIFWNLKKMRYASLDQRQTIQKLQDKNKLFSKFSE